MNEENRTITGKTSVVVETLVIRQGQLWKVTTNELCGNIRVRKECKHCGNITSITERVRLKEGDIIEIRYPYAWHFRTEDDRYIQAEPEVIRNNATLIGEVNEQTRFNNMHKLSEILERKLYTPLSLSLIHI